MTLLLLWITTLLVCIAGALIPLINTEVYLLSVSALSPPAFVGPLVIAATIGQMLGKVVMFHGGRGVARIRTPRVRRGAVVLRWRLRSRPFLSRAILFSSATIGLPPLYVMSVVSGTIGMELASFIAIGFLGRLIHFAFIAWVPQLVKAWVG